MSLLIMATVSIDPVQSRAFTTTRDDSGFSTPIMTVTGYTDRDRTDLAAAKETARQLNELAANYWYRVVHVADSEDSQYDGYYELQSAAVTATPATSNSKAALFAISVTLRRVGGSGVASPNLQRIVRPTATLIANSWSITSQPWYPIPIGATAFINGDNKYLSNADGALQALRNVATYEQYLMSTADVGKGECKVWDTGGSSTRANWKRVWAADHAFASAAHCAIDNGLVTYVPLAARPGQHEIQCWDSSAWQTVTSTTGDGVLFAGTLGAAWNAATITQISPWSVTVRYQLGSSTVPISRIKEITLSRGRHLAYYTLTGNTAARIDVGVSGGSYTRFTFNRNTTDNLNDARDHTVDAAAAVLNTANDNWVASTSPSTTAVVIIAIPTTATATVMKSDTGGSFIFTGSVTSLTCMVGAQAYAAGTLALEAEAGTRTGTAAVGTLAGSSGGGSNNCVSLPAAGDRIESANLSLPALGGASDTVRAYARCYYIGAFAGDSIQIQIWNQTAGAQLTGATTTKTFAAINTAIGASSVFFWISCEGTGWNGTDSLRIRVTHTVASGGATLVVDEWFAITIVGGGLDGPKTIANAALTYMTIWEELTTVVTA
jgi:hypothetical protein